MDLSKTVSFQNPVFLFPPGLELWNEELIGFLAVCVLGAPLAVPFLGAHFCLLV